MSDPSGAHDAVFRRILAEPVNAASQLRAILPAALIHRLDLDRLQLLPGTFIDDVLSSRQSDLLFSVPLHSPRSDRDLLIYVLVEHQSSQDHLMAFRMLRYLIRVWERYLHDHPRAVRLPPVIPVVVYQSRRGHWSAPTQLLDLIDLEPELVVTIAQHLPQLAFILDDLTYASLADLRSRPLTAAVRVTLWLLKVAPDNPDLAAELRAGIDDLQSILQAPGGQEEFIALLRYIELVGETPADQLHDLVTDLGPEAEEAYMTTAEMLRAEGEARGRVEGEARGRVEGEARGRAEALMQILQLRFGSTPQAVRDRLNTASTEQLSAWTARVFSADSLHDLFD